MQTLLNGLNPSQVQAVTSQSNIILTLAGAGSGKTTVMTRRAAFLHQEHRIGTSNMLCLTFSRLAAKEMKERIMKLVGAQEGRKLFVNTFHAFAADILRKWGHKIGLEESFTIYDQDDREAILAAIVSDFGGKTTVKKVLERMENRKVGDKVDYPEECRVIKEYYFRLRQNNAVDLDGLIEKANTLWTKCPDVLKQYRQNYTHVFVDEFQDTSDDQMRMVQSLDPQNLFVVGDDFQAIYGWRNARVEYIINFPIYYPGCEVVKLEDNYRSTGQIVRAANTLIAYNENQTKKTLRAHKDGKPIQVYVTADQAEEAGQIARQISELQTAGVKLSDIAVLARTNKQIETIKGFMDELGIPALVVTGSNDPFKKRDIKLMLAWLDVICNRRDNINFKKALSFPEQHITPLQLRRFELTALESDISLYEAAKRSGECQPFFDVIENIEKQTLATASQFLKALVTELAIGKRYQAQGLENRIQDAENAYAQMIQWEQSKAELGEANDVYAFLKWLRYRDIQEKFIQENSDSVKLMTVHASKGLEFEAVIVAGMAQDIFPSKRSIDLEEERRLFYVAITRAKQHLIITRPQQIEGWGGKILPARPSQFLREAAL